MRKSRSFRVVLFTFTLLLLVAVLPASTFQAESLEQARIESAKTELPVLIKFGVEWSKASNEFDEYINSNEEARTALKENVILYVVDAKAEEGKQLAAFYSVQNFPTFILTNNSGETIDRWYGFGCQDCFVKRLLSSAEDLITVNERLKRYQKHPSEEDARKLGEIRHSEGMFAEAAAYYRRAKEMNPESEINYDTHIFNSMAYGNYYALFSSDQVREQADVVLASEKRSDKDLIKVAFSMYKVSKREDDLSLFTPYLKVSVEETADSRDESVISKRAKLMPEYSLHIEKNEEKAIKLKKTSMPDGWLEVSNELNNFAWWCFENRTNLVEAENIARKGVDLASPGKEKANVLDTLAEICNLSGECGEAVDYIRLAVAEDPENEYFQDQLVRFEKLLAAQR